MSEDKLREQFEAAIVDAIDLKIYKVPERDMQNTWYGFKVCSKIKDAEIQALKGQLSTHQKSEFHPDWSMLEACQDSLREHMGIINLRDAEIEQLNAKVAMLREAIDDALGSFKRTQNTQDYPSTH